MSRSLHINRDLEKLEPYEGKPSCTVLRGGEEGSNALDLPDTPDNPSQSAKYPRPTWENATNNYASSTLYEKDSKYLRLKTLQLAYNFNFPWMKKLKMSTCQLALSGYNLLTFTPYLWGDPETRASNAPSYPLARTYTLSLKLGF